jgi:hypothetical protein
VVVWLVVAAAPARAPVMGDSAAAPASGGVRVLDDFTTESLAGWEAAPAEGVKMSLAVCRECGREGAGGGGLRLEFDFQGHGGYAIARKRIGLDLPENYEFSFWIRGAAPRNNLEFKLLDRGDGKGGGENVWWVVRRELDFPREWQRIVVKKRHLGFAWGPAGGGEIRHAAALEIVVSASQGGSGAVEIAELGFAALPPPHRYAGRPVASASSAAPGRQAARALDGDARTEWHSVGAAGEEQWLAVDFGERRELGGLVIDWDRDDFATRFAVLTSGDGTAWTASRTVERPGSNTAGAAGRGIEPAKSYLYMPDTDARYLRLDLRTSSRGRGYGVREIAVLPVEAAASPNAFFAAVAKDSPRGSYPRAIGGEQALWTLVGVDGGRDQGLLNEDGLLEAGRAGFSIEPFVRSGGALIGWNAVRSTPSLAAGYLPIPSVRWRRSGLAFEITAFAAGPPASPVLYARYRLRNRTGRPLRPRLFLALRPFQVNPPSQWLGRPGGAVEVRRIAFDGRAVEVESERGKAAVVPLSPPAAFGAMSFDAGSLTALLRRGQVPAAAAVDDPFGYASAVLAYDLRLAPRGVAEIDVAIPLGEPAARQEAGEESGSPGEAGAVRVGRLLRETAAGWKARLGGVAIELPAPARPLAETLRTAFAHILISRDGPALRPGTRSYARSWIRDGALISDALLRLGAAREVRDFAAWYAPYQGEGGKVPCCVDARGADPVPENDSAGELLYLFANYYRYTGDRDFVARVWEHVERAVSYLDGLRQQRRGAAYRQPDKHAFYGLLPESISHEGYSARPVHSYWDDFFALRGFGDAAELARALSKDALAARYAALRDEFREDLYASLRRVIAGRGIDYIPGSVELADFDATSTTIAVAPGGEMERLPAAELRHTFARYFDEFTKRQRGEGGTSYTPYEWRAVGIFVRLGWRARAQRLVAGFMADRRPAGWNQWPEVVWRDPRAPGFLGDLPHAWVAAEFIRSFLDMMAYERDSDHALVIAAGVPAAWARSGSGVSVRGLATPFGALSYTLAARGSRARMSIPGGLRIPPGGIAIRWPFAGAVTVNGRPQAIEAGGELVVRELPAEVRVRMGQTSRRDSAWRR